MQKVFLLLLLFSTTRTLAQQDTVKVNADITNATVYFGYGAELTHEAKVKMSSNVKIIVIDKLSTSVDVNSIQVNCPEDVTILSQRYGLSYPKPVVFVKTKEIEALEDSIQKIQLDVNRIDNDIAIENATLEKTGVLIEATITTSGNKTVAGDDVLKLVNFYNAKIEKANKNIFLFGLDRKKLSDKILAIQNKIAKLSVVPPSTEKTYGQLVLQVISKTSSEIPVNISYYTRNAGWIPVYDLRVNSKTNKVKLVYKASLTQSTGVDWKKTKLILSTGTPNFGVEAPILTPWYLQLYAPVVYRALQGKVSGIATNTIPGYNDDKDLKEVVVSGYALKKADAYSINPSTLQTYTTLNEGQLNTNFEIALPYDVESDGQMHSVAIKEEMIDCSLNNYAVPKMQKEAYLLAQVSNWENLDLLPGDANIIVDDTYLGKTLIDPNTTADTLNLPLGKDKRVAVKRTLVKELSSLKSSGGMNKQVFTYEITVKNNKLTDVDLILKDQYPLSTIKEVEIEFKPEDLKDSGAEVNQELGVITWKLDLKPGESKKVRFTYTVKYPKDKKIANLK